MWAGPGQGDGEFALVHCDHVVRFVRAMKIATMSYFGPACFLRSLSKVIIVGYTQKVYG